MVVVSAIIVIRDEKILVLKRSKSSSWSGRWNFPGGSVEIGELPIDAAIRELKEESGLVVKKEDIFYLDKTKTPYIQLNFYITHKTENEVVLNGESQEFLWVDLDELNELKFPGGKLDNILFNKIKEYLKGI